MRLVMRLVMRLTYGVAALKMTDSTMDVFWECALAPSLRICFSPADCCWAVVLLGELKGQTDLSELKLRPPIGNQIG
jgi:hypothetical protein